MRLVAQIHDELLLEVNPQLCDVYVIAGKQSCWLGHFQACKLSGTSIHLSALNCSECMALIHCTLCCMAGCLHLSKGASRHAAMQVLCSKLWKALRA